MAGEEPPYLTVGTDVSAKYKGAFCEAKIKKVTRSVKCKVNFKNNLGTLVVTDDLVRGTLRVGAHVEAKHPEKNQYLEGVINKLHDYSQYTVVFDDGDETTLRRTSLCLKSGRHFAESETLDQLPLTHPEHFGTPVMGSKGRKRRILHRSLIVGDGSSDEEPVVRKKDKPKEPDPDMGKVVCLELGERKKKDNWVPALVVSATAQDAVKTKNKDECIVRSFKDSKFHVANRKDSREFTREIAAKADSNAMKTAVEKALAYLEQNQLPTHWDRDILLGAETPGSADNSDTDSDSSDDEQSEEKDRFVAQLYKFMDDRGTPINKAPTVSNRDLNLYKLFKVVQKLGGYNRTTNQMQWKAVYTKIGLPAYNSSSSHAIKQAYKKYLHSFEDFYRKLGCTMGTSTRSGRVRHRSGRNLMLPRDRDQKERDLKAAGRRAAKQKEKEEKSAKAQAEEEKLKAEDESSQDEPDSGKTEDESQSASGKPDSGIKKEPLDVTPKAVPEEKEKKPSASKSEKKVVVDEDSETDERRHMREIRARLQKEDSEAEDEKSEREDSRCRSRSKNDKSEDSASPNKRRGRKRNAKKGDDDDKGSDDEDAETRRNVTININDRVKVKYGRGRQQKIYEAKVLKLDEEEGDRIYFVHYTGWNMRYDEWVKRHRIVENLTQRILGKRSRAIAKCSKPPGKRGRPRGSTSLKSLGPPGSKGALRSRSTRSDRSSLESSFTTGPDGKRRARKSSGTQESGQGTTGDSSDECYSESVESEIMEQMERRLTRFGKKRASLDDLDTSIEEDVEKSETQEDEEDTQGDEDNEGPGGSSPDIGLFKELPFAGKSFSPKGRTSKDRTDECASDPSCEEEKSPKGKRTPRSKAKATNDSDAEGDASEEEDQPKTSAKPPTRRSRGQPAKLSVEAKATRESSKSKLKDKKIKPKKNDASDKEQSSGELDESNNDVKIFLELKEKVSALPKAEQSSSNALMREPRLFFEEKLPAHESDHQYSEALRDFSDVRSMLFSEMSKPVEKEFAEIASKIEDTAIPVLEDASTRDLNLTAELDFTMYDDVLKEDMGITEALKIVNEGEARSAPNLEKMEPLHTNAATSFSTFEEKAPELSPVRELQQTTLLGSSEERPPPPVENMLSCKESVILKSGCERLFESLLASSSAGPVVTEKEIDAKSAKKANVSFHEVLESAKSVEIKFVGAKTIKVADQSTGKVAVQLSQKSEWESATGKSEIVQTDIQKCTTTDLKSAGADLKTAQIDQIRTQPPSKKGTQASSNIVQEVLKLVTEDQKLKKDDQKALKESLKAKEKALSEDQRTNEKSSMEDSKTSKVDENTSKEVQKADLDNQNASKEVEKALQGDQSTPKEDRQVMKDYEKAPKEIQKFVKEDQKAPNEVQLFAKDDEKLPKVAQRSAVEEQQSPMDAQKSAKEEEKQPKELLKTTKEALRAPKESQKTAKEPQNEAQKITKEDENMLKDSQKIGKEEQKTPKDPQKTLKEPQKTPKEPQKTPKEPQKTPKESQKTPKEPQKAPKEPQKTPKEPQKTPKEPQKTPKETQKTPKETQKTPNEPQKAPKEPQKTSKHAQKSVSEDRKLPADIQKFTKDDQKAPKEAEKAAKTDQMAMKDAQKTEKEEQKMSKEIQNVSKDDDKVHKDVHKLSQETKNMPSEIERLSKDSPNLNDQKIKKAAQKIVLEVQESQKIKKEGSKFAKQVQNTPSKNEPVVKLTEQPFKAESVKEPVILKALDAPKKANYVADSVPKSCASGPLLETITKGTPSVPQPLELKTSTPIHSNAAVVLDGFGKMGVLAEDPSTKPATEMLPEKMAVEEELVKVGLSPETATAEKSPETEVTTKSTVAIVEEKSVQLIPPFTEVKESVTSPEKVAIEEMVMSKIEAIQDVEKSRADSPSASSTLQSSPKGSKRDRRRQKSKKPEKRKVVTEGESSDEGSAEEEPKAKKKKAKEDKIEERREKNKSEFKARKSRDKRSKSKKGDCEEREESRSPKKKGASWKSRRKECKKKKESLEKGRKEKGEPGQGPDSDDTSSLSSEGGPSKKKVKKVRRYRGEKCMDSEKKKPKKGKAAAAESEEATSEDSHRDPKKTHKEDRGRPKRKKDRSRKEQPQSSEESDGPISPVVRDKVESGPEKADVKKLEELEAELNDGDISSYLICEEKVPASPLPEDVAGSGPLEIDGGKEDPVATSSVAATPHHSTAITSFAPLVICPKTEAEPSTVMDNTPPTTPESTSTTASESPLHPGQGSPLPSPAHDMDSGTTGEKSSQSSSPNSYAASYEPHYGLHTKCKLEEEVTSSPKEKMAGLATLGPKRVRMEYEEVGASRKKRRSHRKTMSPTDPNKMTGAGGRQQRHGCGKIMKGSDDSEDVLQMCSDNAVGVPASLGSPYHPITGTLLETQVMPHSPRPSRFNFYVELDDYSDGAERIAVLQEKLTELRRTYLALKAEVACIDRRRKKLKRKEKEASSTAPSSSSTTLECS